MLGEAIVQPILATYKDGVFVPVEPVSLPEGFRVTLWLDPMGVKAQPSEKDPSYIEEVAENRGELLRRMAE
jgi:predicted DNA-binding antitoxin AbrB/MazE fold protein